VADRGSFRIKEGGKKGSRNDMKEAVPFIRQSSFQRDREKKKGFKAENVEHWKGDLKPKKNKKGKPTCNNLGSSSKGRVKEKTGVDAVEALGKTKGRTERANSSQASAREPQRKTKTAWRI